MSERIQDYRYAAFKDHINPDGSINWDDVEEDKNTKTSSVDAQTASDYHQAFNSAMTNSPYSSFVSSHSPEEIANMHSVIMSPDKKAGVLIHDHGDGRMEATGLFNSSPTPGMGSQLMNQAVAGGANYAEAYGPKLPQIYDKLGFKTVEKYPFDKSLAAPDWDYEKFGTPDYHIMTQGGVPVSSLGKPNA